MNDETQQQLGTCDRCGLAVHSGRDHRWASGSWTAESYVCPESPQLGHIVDGKLTSS